MKLNVKYMIAAFALLGLVGCDKNFEEFETSGGGSPAAVELSTVVSEALPGQIKLTWKAPEGDYAYMQIRYYDPLQKKNICKIASKRNNGNVDRKILVLVSETILFICRPLMRLMKQEQFRN